MTWKQWLAAAPMPTGGLMLDGWALVACFVLSLLMILGVHWWQPWLRYLEHKRPPPSHCPKSAARHQ